MSPDQYTQAQKEDIEKRVAQAKVFLEGIGLQPACFVTPVNMGDDVFALKTIAYLQDVKFTAPIQKKDL